jgi:hypothetical protein
MEHRETAAPCPVCSTPRVGIAHNDSTYILRPGRLREPCCNFRGYFAREFTGGFSVTEPRWYRIEDDDVDWHKPIGGGKPKACPDCGAPLGEQTKRAYGSVYDTTLWCLHTRQWVEELPGCDHCTSPHHWSWMED